jgi:hypothetical protein
MMTFLIYYKYCILKRFVINTALYLSIFLVISLYFYHATKHNLITDYTAKKFVRAFSLNNLVQKDEMCEDRRAVYQNIVLHKNKHFNTVFIGSSRIMQLGKYTGINNALNLGLSGANFHDIQYVYKLAKAYNIKYDTLVFDINPWTVCNSVENRQIQFNNFEVFKLFLKDVFTFNYSKKDIQYALSTRENTFHIATSSDVENPDNFIKFSDGSIKQITLGPNKRRGRIRTFCKDLYLLKMFYAIDAELFIKTKNLIETEMSNSTIYIIMSPFHPSLLEERKSDIRIKNLSFLENKIRTEFNSKINIIGSFNPYNLNLSDSNFVDGFHLTEQSIGRLYRNKSISKYNVL